MMGNCIRKGLPASNMKLFNKKKQFVAVDIGTSSIKLMELDCRGAKPYLLNASITPLPINAFSNNQITKKESVAEKLRTALASQQGGETNIVTAMPALAVFTKRISMAAMDPREIATTIRFEAGNYIPQGVDTVKLDYSILDHKANEEIDVLVVAVKNEIVDSFVECFTLAGYDTGIVDVDYFALQNAYELSYPELREKSVCLVHIGARYSFINICKNGVPLFTGNIAVGGTAITQEIAKVMSVEVTDAETLKLESTEEASSPDDKVASTIAKSRRGIVSDLDRQIRIMWNASGADEDISHIFLSGGGALLQGLSKELSDAIGCSCQLLDPFRGFEVGDEFDKEYLAKLSPSMSIAAGLAIRSFGDKEEGGLAA